MKNFNQKGFAPLVVIVIVVALVAIGIGGYFVFKTRVAVAPSPSPSPTSAVTNTPDETANWKTYINTEFGFQLTFTDSWKGYKVQKQTMSSNFGAGSLVFLIPTQSNTYDNSGYIEMFILQIYQPKYWQKIENNDGPKPVFMGRNSNWVFAYNSVQDAISQNIQTAFNDIPKVIASFKLTSNQASITPISQNTCKTTGCSGTICINGGDPDVITTCEYKAEYGCYQKAKCERQTNGQCGFTITSEIRICLDQAKN